METKYNELIREAARTRLQIYRAKPAIEALERFEKAYQGLLDVHVSWTIYSLGFSPTLRITTPSGYHRCTAHQLLVELAQLGFRRTGLVNWRRHSRALGYAPGHILAIGWPGVPDFVIDVEFVPEVLGEGARASSRSGCYYVRKRVRKFIETTETIRVCEES